MKKGEHIYSGKAKSIFATEYKDKVIMHFRDDLTAFNGEKKSVCNNKGIFNNYINAFLMQQLAAAGINVSFIKLISARESLVKNLDIIQLEFVIRNIAAGTIIKRLGLGKGVILEPPVKELYLKNDDLGDPLVNKSHIKAMKIANIELIESAEKVALNVNESLKYTFNNIGIDLVDFKIEFGQDADGKLYLADEISPDSCRLWDKSSKRLFDKDLFRFDLGDIATSYKDLAQMLEINLPDIGNNLT